MKRHDESYEFNARKFAANYLTLQECIAAGIDADVRRAFAKPAYIRTIWMDGWTPEEALGAPFAGIAAAGLRGAR